MYISTIVIENFLDNPYSVRESVLSIDFKSKEQHPGFRSDPVDDQYLNYVKDKISRILRKRIPDIGIDQSGRFQLCLENDKSWIHTDSYEWSGVLFLTPDAPVNSGTGIYRHIESNEISIQEIDHSDTPNLEENKWEVVTIIGNVFNRLVLFDGKAYHRSLVSGFGDRPSTGRLTQVFFFNTQDLET